MKVEVVHTIKFDKKVEKLLELVAAAITGAVVAPATSTESEPPVQAVAQTGEAKEEKPNVATKIRYFQHEGTSELIVVKKGESLDFLEGDIFDELTAAQYNSVKAEQEKAVQVAEETAPPEEEQTVTDLTLADLRVVAAKFVSNAKQKELKALFGEFEDTSGKPAVKISAIQEKDYDAFMNRAKETLAELGVE